jgi:hypothetical protein
MNFDVLRFCFWFKLLEGEARLVSNRRTMVDLTTYLDNLADSPAVGDRHFQSSQSCSLELGGVQRSLDIYTLMVGHRDRL